MKQKYDMVCVKDLGWWNNVKKGDKCRILDFKRYDNLPCGIKIALEFEKNIDGHSALFAFDGIIGKYGHCLFVDKGDMESFKFID
jgi:hypothetical protein